MIDTDFREVEVNTFFSCLNIHPVQFTLLKRYENIVGNVMIQLANESCREAILEERALTLALE